MIAAMEYHQVRSNHNIHPQQELPAKKIKTKYPNEFTIYSWEYVDEATSYEDARVRRVLVNDRWYIFTF